MRRRKMTGLSLACCSMLLAACAAPEPQVIYRDRVELLRPPAALMECPDSPEPPAEILRQSTIALYLVELWRAGQECRSRLMAIKAIVDAAGAP